MPTPRLRTTGAATLITAALVLSACGDSDSGSDGGSGDGAFPVTIESSLGDAKIKKKPEKIVTLGQGSTETAIAMGHTPVGMEEYEWAADESGYTPWVHEAVKEEGDDLPEFVGEGEKLDMEKIVELEPDVILASYSGLTQEDYDTLSQIAPVVVGLGLGHMVEVQRPFKALPGWLPSVQVAAQHGTRYARREAHAQRFEDVRCEGTCWT